MAQIPPEIVAKLKCDFCKGFLSCPPVFETSNKRRSCGRCPKPEASARRMELYETIANLLSFPCNNRRWGCKYVITFISHKYHDNECDFKPYYCPLNFDGRCAWYGPRKTLVDHCEDDHGERVLFVNPNAFVNNITKTYYQVYLVLAFADVYILQVKVCHNARKLYHCVRLVGNDKDVDTMSFKVSVYTGNDKITKSNRVLPEMDLKFDENVCASISFDSMIDVLGVFDRFITKVTVFRSCVKCKDKCSVMNYYHDSGYLCRPCEEEKLKNLKF